MSLAAPKKKREQTDWFHLFSLLATLDQFSEIKWEKEKKKKVNKWCIFLFVALVESLAFTYDRQQWENILIHLRRDSWKTEESSPTPQGGEGGGGDCSDDQLRNIECVAETSYFSPSWRPRQHTWNYYYYYGVSLYYYYFRFSQDLKRTK